MVWIGVLYYAEEIRTMSEEHGAWSKEPFFYELKKL